LLVCTDPDLNRIGFDDLSQAFPSAFSTPEHDGLRGSTVSCEIIDIPRRAAVQWRMPAEIPNDHLTEIATILAAGLLRLQSRKSSPNFPLQADSSLDCERVFGGDVGGDFEDFRP
jgi:hypothetical protein